MTRLGRRRGLLLAHGGCCALLVAIAGCQLVAGIQSRALDPLNPGCALPSAAGPMVRVANLVPTSDLVDVCIRPAGASSWGRPILLDGGTDCAATLGSAGFSYAQVSVPFTAPAASVDVKTIPGGTTCDTTALSEGDGLTLATNAVTTLASIGGNSVAPTVVALPEADSVDQTDLRIRFVHAMAGTGPLDFGLTANEQLPTTITTSLLAPIAFGTTPTAGEATPFASAAVGDNGYFGVLAAAFYIGAAVDGGTAKAILLAPFTGSTAATFSLYAIGVAGDNAHPLRGLVCDEDATVTSKNPLLAPCVGTPLSTISVDVFNAALYGPNAPYNTQRTPLIAPAIAHRDSDIVCLTEVDALVDRQNIITAALPANGGPYPYSYSVTTNLSTPITNPANQMGQIPPAPTAPPCSTVQSSLISDTLTCAEQYCSTEGPGDPSGELLDTTDCISGHCAGQFVAVESANPACFDCLIDYIASDESWGTCQNHCTMDLTPPLGFDGQTQSIILSRYPLVNTDALILPSTLYRRAVLYAQVELEDQTVDFYCGFLISTLIASDLPYDGSYGNGATDSQTAWDSEQLFQGQQLVSWVQKKSQGQNPAIIAGEWRSSIGISSDGGAPDAGVSLPKDLNPQTMQLFQSTPGWTFATASGAATSWVPQCNYCPITENPYNGPDDSYFTLQPILANWPGDPTAAATDESLQFTGDVLQLDDDAGLGPISPYYGVNIRVLRPLQ